MNCYGCDRKDAEWNVKFGKYLCVSCAEALYHLELYREKISALSQAHYNQAPDSDGKKPPQVS